MTKALVDFSSLFHRLWHVNREEVEFKCRQFLGMINGEVIICIDSPPYKRKTIDPAYKANRDIPDPTLLGALRLSIQAASDEGYTIASCEGWEADDVIATLIRSDPDSIVYGTDKDLLQCTDLIVPFTNDVKTPENTLGVSRDKVIDYLCLVGDTSDNIKGVVGIGPKTAVKMLETFGTLTGIYEAVRSTQSRFTEKTATALLDSLEWSDRTRELITLNSDLELVISKNERKETAPTMVETEYQLHTVNDGSPLDFLQSKICLVPEVKQEEPQYIVKHETVDYRHALEPVGVAQAYRTAEGLHRSGLYQTYKSPEQIMAVIMRGRTLGLDATTALDTMNVIQGRPTMSAQCMVAVVKASPVCEFFECMDATDQQSTWETKRRGERKSHSRTFTLEEADRAGFTTAKEWDKANKRYTGKIITKDNWEKQPSVMLQWRAAAALIRQVYPDLILGIYATEEME